MDKPTNCYDILNRLDATGDLDHLVKQGLMPVKIGTHLDIYRLVDMRIRTGTPKTKAVVEAAVMFRMCESSIFRVIRSMGAAQIATFKNTDV